VQYQFRQHASAASGPSSGQYRTYKKGRTRLKRDGTCAETRFGLSETWTSPFKLAGESVQSTAGSRGVRISGQTMDGPCTEVQWESSGYPLQLPISPLLPLPRVTACRHVSNGLYNKVSAQWDPISFYSNC